MARKGFMSWPNAPPKGFARDAIAVAEIRPEGVNQRSEKWVGADRTKGWASPMRICPNIVRPNLGGEVRVPAYRIQFPKRMRREEIMIARRGPPVWRAQIVTGVAARKENMKPVLSQLMMLGFVEKKSAEMLATGA